MSLNFNEDAINIISTMILTTEEAKLPFVFVSLKKQLSTDSRPTFLLLPIMSLSGFNSDNNITSSVVLNLKVRLDHWLKE